MARQLLTFVIFIGVFMLLMRGCKQPPSLGEPPVGTANVVVLDETELLTLEQGGVTVMLAGNGTVYSITKGGQVIQRPVPSWMRPFHLLVVTRKRKFDLPTDRWTYERVENGFRFTGVEGALQIIRTVTLTDSGLDCDLQVTGAGEDATNFWMSGAAGVPLTGTEDVDQSGVVWEIDERPLKLTSFGALVEKRETEHGKRQRQLRAEESVDDRDAFGARAMLAAGTRVKRFGLLGRTHVLALEGLPPTSALLADPLYCKREDGETTNEIETWVDLIARNEGYAGVFSLRWQDRANLEGESLLEKSEFPVLENDTFRAVFATRGASIREMWLKSFSTTAGEVPSEKNWVPILHRGVRPSEQALTLSANETARYGVNPAHQVWEAQQGLDYITFTLKTPTGWVLTKTVRFAHGYTLDVEITATRPKDSKAQTAKFSLVGPVGAYIEDTERGVSFAEPGAAIRLERDGGDDETLRLTDWDKKETPATSPGYGQNLGLLRAVAVRGAYFVVALVTTGADDPRDGIVTSAELYGVKMDRDIERADGETWRKNMGARVACAMPLPDGTGTATFTLYAGPNQVSDLRPLGIDDTVDFRTFGAIGRLLMALMKLFQSVVGSYGVAIMLMTLVVRACLLPFSYKTQLSMQRYQKRFSKVKPLLEELEKKYGKKNPQKMNQERMRIMKEHKVGFPLGCLTMFLQIPIWFALFGALRVEFALRHQTFLWCNDLAMPDQLFALPSWLADLPVVPEYFNFLPILMLVLWVAQQRLTPTPGGDDPQVKMQMKMMKFFPFVFFFMLYNYAAALSVYMCVSSAWSIMESKYVRKAIKKLA